MSDVDMRYSRNKDVGRIMKKRLYIVLFSVSIIACSLIENYHFFTTRITTFGASAILNRGYVSYQN